MCNDLYIQDTDQSVDELNQINTNNRSMESKDIKKGVFVLAIILIIGNICAFLLWPLTSILKRKQF